MTWKPYLIVTAVLAFILIGAYAKGIYDEAGQADLLRQQIKATSERLARQNAVAMKTETQMQADRSTIAALNRKWNATRAQKDRTACQLDPDALRVLQDASTDDAPAR